jgi:hypothetical protein
MTGASEASKAPALLVQLLQAEQDGIYTRLEMFARIFSHITCENVNDVIAALSSEHRSSFVAWVRENYDNAMDPSEFIYVGAEGENTVPREAFAGIRQWLAKNPKP